MGRTWAPWSSEEVLALASDEPSRTAARRTASPGLWSGTGTADGLVWGECSGSGGAPYRTVVAVSGPEGTDDAAGPGPLAHTCTCPSRKVPCKHVLALLLLWSADAVGGPTGGGAQAPPYAVAWSAGRADRAARSSPAPPGEAGGRAARGTSPATVARRSARVRAGLEELERWLADQVRTGVAGASADAYHRFDPVAARMVDAQAPGVAGTLRRLPQVVATGGDWPGRLLEELAGLHLLVRAHERLDTLPEGLAATVRARVGYTVRTQAVLAGAGVDDRWQVIAAEESEQAGLTTRRTWLWGETSDRPALVLTFGAGGQSPDASLRVGTVVEGPAHFHPGDPPLRAVLGDRVVVDRLDWVTASRRPRTVARLLDEAAAALASDPWTSAWPALLEARPAGGPGRWALVDADGVSLSVLDPRGSGADWWRLLAVSGGAPVTAAVEVVGGAVRVLGAWPLVVSSGGWGAQAAAGTPAPSDALSLAGSNPKSDASPGADPPSAEAEPAVRRSAAWRELVAAATVGAGTRPLPTSGFHPLVAGPADGVDRSDPATALLDLAALETRAAAAAPVTGRATPLPAAPAETAPVAGPRLVTLLLDALALDRDLTVDLLGRAVAGGVVAPPTSAVALLAIAQRGGPPVRALVDRLGGERLRWLGRVDPTGAVLRDAPSPSLTGAGGPAAEDGGDAAWAGVGPGREAWLRATRATHPDRARAALERTWAQETPPDRARFLACLTTGLGAGDEPSLERALDDRRREVREVALRLLVRLAGSVTRGGGATAYGRRARTRAAPYVVLGTRGLRRTPVLRVDAPADLDEVEARAAGAARDGLGVPPPARWPGGPRAWLLARLLVATPLAVWEQVVGGAPEHVLALPREGELALVLDAAWTLAAVEQGDEAWARALLAARPDAPAMLVGVLPPEERAGPVTALLAGTVAQGRPVGPDLAEVLEPVPAPWPRELGAGVRAVAEAGLDPDGLLVALAARRVRLDDPDDADRWRAWARRLHAQPGVRPGARRALDRLGRVVELRTAVEEELGLALSGRGAVHDEGGRHGE